ncbi:AbfB domain-containing protein [Streptomyces thermolilacinus]|uniref:AbfB domain-containing protein n=1 Tax=Streptomyces thermolilacinus TaxID=285540 RepID=UPI0033E78AA4
MSVRLSLFSNNFSDHFIIDRTSGVDIARVENDLDRDNATFEWTGGPTSGETGQLLRAAAPLGSCLRIATFDDFRIHSKFFTGIDDPDVAAEVRADSTFTLQRAEIDPNHFSFRSVRFPNRFIRHRDFKLFAGRVNTPPELQSACFRFNPPLADQ